MQMDWRMEISSSLDKNYYYHKEKVCYTSTQEKQGIKGTIEYGRKQFKKKEKKDTRETFLDCVHNNIGSFNRYAFCGSVYFQKHNL